MNRWFTSDWHLGHENIIRFCGRPFDNARQMDECLLDYHNQFVKPEDHYTNLGDVTLGRGGKVQQDEFLALIKKFNGHGRLHLGNHDHFPIKVYAQAFEKVYATWRDEQGLLFSHMPIHAGSIGSAQANIHGHIHQNTSPPPVVWIGNDGKKWIKPYVNICVEKTNYHPIHYDEVMQRVSLARENYLKNDSQDIEVSNESTEGPGTGS